MLFGLIVSLFAYSLSYIILLHFIRYIVCSRGYFAKSEFHLWHTAGSRLFRTISTGRPDSSKSVPSYSSAHLSFPGGRN
uniref:Secreted protein n=1 Tax=Globodera rostochiensis TaxID=31243 RepID=A0A914H1V1_GLORO